MASIFDRFKSAKSQAPSAPLEIVESLAGNWFYHLQVPRPAGSFEPRKALCGGTHIMASSAPLSSWGYRGHLNERYCADCAKVAADMGLANRLGAPEPA